MDGEPAHLGLGHGDRHGDLGRRSYADDASLRYVSVGPQRGAYNCVYAADAPTGVRSRRSACRTRRGRRALRRSRWRSRSGSAAARARTPRRRSRSGPRAEPLVHGARRARRRAGGRGTPPGRPPIFTVRRPSTPPRTIAVGAARSARGLVGAARRRSARSPRSRGGELVVGSSARSRRRTARRRPTARRAPSRGAERLLAAGELLVGDVGRLERRRARRRSRSRSCGGRRRRRRAGCVARCVAGGARSGGPACGRTSPRPRPSRPRRRRRPAGRGSSLVVVVDGPRAGLVVRHVGSSSSSAYGVS